ncbi:putative glycerol-3-phosphate dehydrogenase [Pseudomonas paraeruginosa]|uniref:Glycerol-3-phosphate dehydrogenase n=1 Tax=Pseudomonas paraeruginosa TaxID=2994495 RepID=A0A2R3IWG9_9PSED|nr:putative glycerol-3-phosphate dehydrogenase [Pseudomonas paraeruginosa]
MLFAKEHRQAAPGCVGGDPYTVDATADHGDIVDFGEWSGGGVRLTHVKGPEVESERRFVRIRK